MAKKQKDGSTKGKANPSEIHSKSTEDSNSPTVFKALFGDVSTSSSLFSDTNPFRRKPQENLAPSTLESGLGFVGKDPKNSGNLDASAMNKEKKRKKDKLKEETPNVAGESTELKGKKLRGANVTGDSGYSGAPAVGPGLVKGEEKKKKKRKRDEIEAEYEARKYGAPDSSKEAEKGAAHVVGEKRKNLDNPEDMMVSKEGFDDEDKLLRTIFVGNLPLKLKKKEISKEFSKFGEVESVRIRSVPIVDGKIPRKGAVIKKQFSDNADSVHAYVVFKTEESAQASLAHNMAMVGGNHIRVDRACPPRKKLKGDNTSIYDNKRTVFVGNLPFDVKDEEIYQLFTGIKNHENSIEAVRVVRDPGSSIGKGIAYVLFKTKDAANLIAKRRNLRIRGRELRLSVAKSPDETPLKRKDSSPDGSSAKRFAGSSRTPDSSNSAKPKMNLSYQGLRATKSKSSTPKKNHTANKAALKPKPKPKSKSQPAIESKSGKKKRPAVAARKEKALRAGNAPQSGGTKRKLGNRTPQSGRQNKKARKS